MWHCQQIYSRSNFYHISRKKRDRMFNNILPELLTAIFEHLPYQSLKQALLVSRLVVIIIPNQNKSNSKSFLTKLPNYFWQEVEVSWGSSWIVEEVSPPHQGKHLRGQPALAEPGARHQKVQHPWMCSPWLGLLPTIRQCPPHNPQHTCTTNSSPSMKTFHGPETLQHSKGCTIYRLSLPNLKKSYDELEGYLYLREAQDDFDLDELEQGNEVLG